MTEKRFAEIDDILRKKLCVGGLDCEEADALRELLDHAGRLMKAPDYRHYNGCEAIWNPAADCDMGCEDLNRKED